MGSVEQTNRAVYPSLEAFKVAKGIGGPKRGENPLAKFYDRHGGGKGEPWATGQIQDYDPPFPVVISIKSEADARKAAHAGARPIADADPEIKAMLFARCEHEEKKGVSGEVPPDLKAWFASEKASKAKPAAKPAQ